MLTMGSALGKGYVNRGVQTDSNSESESLLHSENTKSSVRRVCDPSVSRNVVDSSQHGSAYSYSLSSDSFSPPRLAILPRHRYKSLQLPYNRLSDSSKRVVSLPETSLSYSAEPIHEQNTLRIVSMAERSGPLSFTESTLSSNCLETSTNTSHLSTDDGLGHCRIRALPASSDLPHTPSPPSSPESVLIIGNNVHVPQSFLRHKAESHAPFSDDGGWITWASSPPRPIPALHGPLSLPYARCPSGAEGTIIEGDDLSRMIWGLANDSSQPTHVPLNSLREADHKTTHQMTIPPLLQKSQIQDSHIRRAPNARVRPSPIVLDHDRRLQTVLHQHALGNVGSQYPPDTYSGATLNIRSRSQSARSPSTWRNICDNQYLTPDLLVDELCTYDREGGLGLDWQATLRGPSFMTRNVEFTDCLKPSAPVFVPASQTPQYPCHRIFVERRPAEQNSNPPRQIADIEIALPYCKMHPSQLPCALPTPPSSSSPKWSPYYPDSFSCRDIPFSRSPRQQSVNAQQQIPQQPQPQQLSQDDFSQDMHRFVNKHVGTTGINSANISFGAAAHIKRPRSVSHPSLEFAPLLSQCSQHRNSNIHISPPHPGPPPNGPLPPIPLHRGLNSNTQYPPQTLSLLSKMSPEPRSRTLSYQQPRSIPLTRLIQRRLSSVPEEACSFLEQVCSPPPSPGATPSRVSGQLPYPQPVKPFFQQSQSIVGDHGRSMSTPSPAAELLNPQTRTGLVTEFDGLWKMPVSAATQRATVKLPLRTINYTVDMLGGCVVADNRGERQNATKEKEKGIRRSDNVVNIRATPKRKARSWKNKSRSEG